MAIYNPCIECLVRACCREACPMMREYVLLVLETIIDDPHHGILEEQFSKEQADLILSTAEMIRRHRENNENNNKL